jgi:hypothetical protein
VPTAPGFATCSYELKHTLMTRSAFLTFGVDPSGTDPNAIAVSLASAFAGTGSLFSCIDNGVTLQNTRVSLGTDGGADIVGASPTVVACTKSLGSLPPNSAALVHKVTARGGRRGRGRMYIPWCISSGTVSEAGTLVAADITAIQNAVDAWRTALNGLSLPLVLLHRPSLPEVVPPTIPGPPDVVTSMRVDPLVATQRRRLGR